MDAQPDYDDDDGPHEPILPEAFYKLAGTLPAEAPPWVVAVGGIYFERGAKTILDHLRVCPAMDISDAIEGFYDELNALGEELQAQFRLNTPK